MAMISYLTTIRFDVGAIKHLVEDMRAVGITRPLLVTDKGLAKTGMAARILDLLPAKDKTPVFDDTPSNPTETAADAALALYREHDCDGLIALGGGSPMDLAKAVGLLATHPGPLRQYAMVMGGVAKITDKVAPVLAIPTTSGTGSEVGRASLMSFNDGRKFAIVSPHLIPRRAICDPELTYDLPVGLTAATGMDALTHGIECFISGVDNPPAGAIALDCAVRAASHIERAVQNGKDKQARWEMMMASMMGAMAFQKGLGAVHGLSHALGGRKEVSFHHGTLNAVLLPAVLRYNAGSVGDKYATLARWLNIPATLGIDGFIADLNQRLGMPKGLGAMGMRPEWSAEVAANAMEDHATQTNPRKPTVSEYEALLAEAM